LIAVASLHGVLVIDKPSGPSSHDVVRAVRRAFGTRGVGHAGTLDPLASGVLVIGIGEGTKLLGHLSAEDKMYLATVRLGAETDTLDSQGRVVATSALPEDLSYALLERALGAFRGEHLQQVPVISAVKQAGLPLYERARRGEVVVAPTRQVVVHALDLLRAQEDELDLRVHCGKGFYVRGLARDLARALGTHGHLTQLRRIASGAFTLADAIASTQIEAEGAARLLSLADALRGSERLTLTAQGVIEVGHGRPLTAAHVREGAWPAAGSEPVALVDEQGALRALGRAEAERVLVVRGIVQPG
jgi:tRNA pseudouridine55 synthase